MVLCSGDLTFFLQGFNCKIKCFETFSLLESVKFTPMFTKLYQEKQNLGKLHEQTPILLWRDSVQMLFKINVLFKLNFTRQNIKTLYLQCWPEKKAKEAEQ